MPPSALGFAALRWRAGLAKFDFPLFSALGDTHLYEVILNPAASEGQKRVGQPLADCPALANYLGAGQVKEGATGPRISRHRQPPPSSWVSPARRRTSNPSTVWERANLAANRPSNGPRPAEREKVGDSNDHWPLLMILDTSRL